MKLRLVTFSFLGCLAFAQSLEKRVSPVDTVHAEQFKRTQNVGVAVLVGVGNYPRYSGLSSLRYPAADVDLLAAALKGQRYMVMALKDSDATKASILNAIQQAGEVMAGENANVIFFFSGHGFAVNGENFLAGLDSDVKNLSTTGLSVKVVEHALAKTPAARRVMWIDACRDEPGKGVGEARSFASLAASAGTRMLLSTKAGKVSFEDEDLKQGVFSYYLVKGLNGEAAGPDGLITFQDLATFVTLQVRTRSLETGRVQIPYEAGEASGDFLIAGKPTPAPVATAPALANPPIDSTSSQSRPPYNWPAAMRICATVTGKKGCATWLWRGAEYLAQNDDGTTANVTFAGPLGNGLIEVSQKGPHGVTGKYIGSFNANGKGSGTVEYRQLLVKIGGTWTADLFTNK